LQTFDLVLICYLDAIILKFQGTYISASKRSFW